MTARDLLALSLEALRAHRLRYALSGLAIAVGIAAVVLLVSIGEGTRRFVQTQVSAFGTTLVGVHRGRVETQGIPGAAGGARPLTLDDARALRRIPGLVAATPYAWGTALVRGGGRQRRVIVQGVTAELPRAWQFRVAEGEFLPAADWDRRMPVTVLGPRLARELFGSRSPVGERVRIGEARFRVIGVMEPKGQFVGFDLDDTAYIPVADCLALFNLSELIEVDLVAASLDDVESVAARARALMRERHRGDDVTVVSQKESMAMVDNVLRMLTGAVAAIAAISLLVGSIGILTILWIVVRERTNEIGLVRALGGTRRQIALWYLCEAALTAAAGGVAGLLVGVGGAALLSALVPGMRTWTSPEVAVGALVLSVAVGLAAGAVPALRAARLDPVESLRAE